MHATTFVFFKTSVAIRQFENWTAISSLPSREPFVAYNRWMASDWTFLTNHAHVLVCVAQDPGVRLRDIAERVGITERAAQRIISDLVEGGYLVRHRDGRRNHYELNVDLPLRHPLEQDRQVGELLSAVGSDPTG